ncbi:MAG: hypothetical protein EPN94_10980 [Nitrospirae bacterium]|nr:MAG: hypothetical protein EPN94_10980 [Nitrospirota bacterium]
MKLKDNILQDLREADRRGLYPPQNWTTRAADEIDRLRELIDRKVIAEVVNLENITPNSIVIIRGVDGNEQDLHAL